MPPSAGWSASLLVNGSSSAQRAGRLIVPAELSGLDRYHRDPLDRVFGPDPPSAPIDPGMKFLFLCFTNRCGSNFLAELIASTGRLNRGEEVFNASTVQAHATEQGLRSLAEYVNFLCRRLNMSGWLTAKIGIEQLVMLTEAGILDQILARSRFILIERQDRLAQAISRLVAVQNGQWTSAQTTLKADEALIYDRAALEAQQADVAFQNQAFYRFFAANGLVPKHLAYEAIAQSPQEYLSDIGTWLGFESFVGDLSALRIHRQDSAVKHRWRARYEAGE